MLADVSLQSSHQVRSVVEQCAHALDGVFHRVEHIFKFLASDGLDTANTSCNTALTYDLEHADMACRFYMDTTTELYTVGKLNDTYLIAIFLTKQGDGSHLLGFFQWGVAMLLQWDVSANLSIYDAFYLAEFFICHLLEVREVEAQGLR